MFIRLRHVALTVLLLGACGGEPDDPMSLALGLSATPQKWPPYLDTSWPTIHVDPANSDFTDEEVPLVMGSLIHALPLTANLVGETVDDTRGLVYQASGAPDQPRLHAFYTRSEQQHQAGQLAWSSAGWPLVPQLDVCAAGSTAIIDTQGNIYISDCSYLWSSTSTGTLRWRAPLPVDARGQRWPFVSAFFTPSGEVGGVGIGGMVALFNRATGAVVATLQLSGLIDPPDRAAPLPLPPLVDRCLWRDALGTAMMDRNLVTGMLSGGLGRGMPVANTPAVRPVPASPCILGQIFIPGVLQQTNLLGEHHVKLFRVEARHDPTTGKTKLTEGVSFGGLIPGGKGSATSPTLSVDGRTIFVGDSKGYLHAFDTDSGQERWKTLVGSMYGAITAPRYVVGGGALPLFVGGDQTITALEANTGAIRWQRSYAHLAEQRVPPSALFQRVALVAGVMMASSRRIILPFTLGYRLPSPSELTVWPMSSLMVVLDYQGNVIGVPRALPDVSETSARVDRSGNVHVGFAAIASSIAHCLWRENTLGLAGKLPEPIKPVGGLGMIKGLIW